MFQRRRFKQTDTLEHRLSEEAKRLREEAKLLPPSAVPTPCSAEHDRPKRVVELSRVPNSNLVFVVDDDPGLLRAVARLLRQLGYACLLFPSAEAFANHGDFDGVVCVLLDIDLGDGSGIELRHRLKAAGNTVPIIYMTANDSPAVRMAAHQSGCLAYLTKPFSAKSLWDLLRRASAGHRRGGVAVASIKASAD